MCLIASVRLTLFVLASETLANTLHVLNGHDGIDGQLRKFSLYADDK